MRDPGQHIALALALVASASTAASADEPVEAGERAPRRPDATWREVTAGPFPSPRLFEMPVADTVGAYVLSISYDGSLLQEPGVLSSAGVLALGVGDIAQLEYRHTSAISVERTSAPLPAVGIQIAAPLPERSPWPTIAGAFRLGVPRNEEIGGFDIEESVTDLYLVAAWQLPGKLRTLTAHAGLRLSRATIEVSGGPEAENESDRLLLPAGGLEWRASESARLIAEVGMVPRFRFDVDQPERAPSIGNGLQGRVGVRWQIHPILSIDASLGYHVDVAATDDPSGRDAVLDWDIRLGGELFVPWGAIACRSLQIFCEGDSQ